MSRWRHLFIVAWLAFALVGGQRLAVLHDLGHATDRISHKDGDAPACKIHFACSQLSHAAGGTGIATPSTMLAMNDAPLFRALTAFTAPIFAFLSTGPPQVSA